MHTTETRSAGKVTDLYTKLGASGFYSAYLVLLPEYAIGFSILAAGSSVRRYPAVAALADAVINALVPALEAQAAVETANHLAGVYTAAATDNSGSLLNSSLVLMANDALSQTPRASSPGLVISSWVSNGTDVLPFLGGLVGPSPFRLLPSVVGGMGRRIAFRLVGAVDALSLEETPGALFSSLGMMSGDWLSVDASTYYGAGLSLFVFEMGQDGRAMAVTLSAYRATLARLA